MRSIVLLYTKRSHFPVDYLRAEFFTSFVYAYGIFQVYDTSTSWAKMIVLSRLPQVIPVRLRETTLPFIGDTNFFLSWHDYSLLLFSSYIFWSDVRAVDGGSLENYWAERFRGFESLSLRWVWRCGRAVIQRIANPSVPKGLGRFNSCRLRSQQLYCCMFWDCSSAGLEHHPAEVGVARSNRVSLILLFWKDARAVDSGGLENR